MMQEQDLPTQNLYAAAYRVIRLVQLLTTNECTRQVIFDKLATEYRLDSLCNTAQSSRKTNKMFERDLNFLKEAGYEVVKRKVDGRFTCYRLVLKSDGPAIFLFTPTQIESLALLYNMFSEKNDETNRLDQPVRRNPFGPSVLALLTKLAAALPPDQFRQFQHHTAHPSVHFNPLTAADYLPHRATIDLLEKACRSRQQVRFQYQPLHRPEDQVEHQTIDPYQIEYNDGHFYLIGYSHKRNLKGGAVGFLPYRVDRIVTDSLKMLPNMIDVRRTRPQIEFSYWLHDNSARRGVSLRWVWQQIEREEIYQDEQGQQKHRALVRARDYDPWRIVQKLLKYGEQAELVSGPPELIERMRSTVERMYKLYNP